MTAPKRSAMVLAVTLARRGRYRDSAHVLAVSGLSCEDALRVTRAALRIRPQEPAAQQPNTWADTIPMHRPQDDTTSYRRNAGRHISTNHSNRSISKEPRA